MKKFSFSRLASALAASAMILMAAFSGCSSSSSGGGGGDEEEEKKQEEEAGKTGTVSIKVAVDDSENPTYTVTFHDSDGINADDVQQIESGKTATVPSWTKDGFTLTWTSSVSGLAPASSITADVTFTTVWTEKPKCSNCGTHYDTQAEADACSKQSGCPNYGKVTTITFAAQSSKSSTATASSDNDGITVSVTGSMKSGGTLTYGNVTYNLLKIESSTSIEIKGAAGKTVTIVMDQASKKIKVGGTAITGDSSGVATTTAPSGDSFTITKGDAVNVGVIFIE